MKQTNGTMLENGLTAIYLKDLPKATYFTRKPVEYPTENQVYIKDDYERTERKYYDYKWSDISACMLFKPDTIVYVGFTF